MRRRPCQGTHTHCPRPRKDITMKLLCVLFAILAISFADESAVKDVLEDSEAVASVELLKTADVADLKAAAGEYVPPSKRPPRGYNPQQISQQNNWQQPGNSWTTPSNTWIPPQNNWTPPQNTWTQPQNNWASQENVWNKPQNSWTSPPSSWSPPNVPQNPWGQQPQQDVPSYAPSTTPVAIIKNEQFYGENGNYKYEYQIGDGTHVNEEGYVLNPNTEQENLVKKGWYSYVGGDGKTYTVTWWADNSGFHPSGDHLPKPPPVPPAIQASIDAQKIKDTQQQQTNPQQTYPQQNYPQQTYPQQTYPQQTYPQQTYPQQTYPQQTYPQQTYPQQTYPQLTYPQKPQAHPYST